MAYTHTQPKQFECSNCNECNRRAAAANKQKTKAERGGNTNTDANIPGHTVANTNRIHPASQPVSHISINPVLRTTIYQCIKQSIHQSIHFHRNVRRLYVSSNAKLRTNMPSGEATLSPSFPSLFPRHSSPLPWQFHWLTQPTPRAEVCTVFGLAQLKRF